MRCLSFCPTESYDLSGVASYLRSNNYILNQYRKVIHATKPGVAGDIFIFSYGCLVLWGLRKSAAKLFLEQLRPYSINPLSKIEEDEFIYRYGANTELITHSRYNVDIIVLNSDSVQLKLAISYGLAQSIQLESYEAEVQKTIDRYAHYPMQIACKGKIALSKKETSMRMGEIFIARSHINLNSDYLSVPEYFWEYSSFEHCYTLSKKFLDIPNRVSALNQKLDVLHELFDMLHGQRQDRHANMLEIVVIVLIFSEIMITLIEKIHLL